MARTFTTSELLELNPRRPETLFGADGAIDTLHSIYKTLSKQWHPNANPGYDTSKVFNHIKLMYDNAVKATEAGRYGLGMVPVPGTGRYARKVVITPLGHLGIDDELIVETSSLGDGHGAGFKLVWPPPFKTASIQAQMVGLLPDLADWSRKTGLAVGTKHREDIRLADVVSHFGCLEPRAVAWVVSGLYNLACYLQIHDLVFNAFHEDYIWVRPATHAVSLKSTWFYALKVGDTVKCVPQTTMDAANVTKEADCAVDRACIKAIVRRLLGDPSGMAKKDSTPAQLANFASAPSTGDAIQDYANWREALQGAFGARKFIAMDLRPEQVY